MRAYRISREEGSPIHHLCKDAAYGPYVYGGRVVLPTEQYLWCSIPEGDNLDTQNSHHQDTASDRNVHSSL